MRIPAVLALLASSALAQLPPPPVPAENPVTPQKAVLGKILYWEEQLSSDDSVACATCHIPEFGGADPRLLRSQPLVNPGLDGVFGTADDSIGSPGVVRQDAHGDYLVDGTFGLDIQVTPRLAPTAVGAAYHSLLFWDGRAFTRFTDPETNAVAIQFDGALESQAVGPIMNPVEMGHQGRTWNEVRQKLQRVTPLRLATNLTPDIVQALQQHPTYPDLFAAAFGDPAINAQRIAFAIATYERTLNPDQTPWDRFMNGDPNALSPQLVAGMNLFNNQGRCAACHIAPLFSDDVFHNLGIRPWQEDAGLMNTTLFYTDRGLFKTPSLRNAGLRPRGMHNGSMPQLGTAAANNPDSMINFYLFGGGQFRENIDPFMIDLSQYGVTVADMTAIEDFVRFGLLDPRVAQQLPPFDHPTLRSMVPNAQPHRFGAALAGTIEPFLIDTAPLYLGNRDYRIGMAGSPGSPLGFMIFGLGPQPLPAQYLGIPIDVVMMTSSLFVLGGSANEPAHYTWHMPVPGDPGFSGLQLHTQLFVYDPSTPNNVAASQGYVLPVR